MTATLNSMEEMLRRIQNGESIVETKKTTTIEEEPIPSNATYFRLAGSLFRNLVNIGEYFVEEMTLEVTKEGLSWKQFEPSHIALGDVFIPAKACERFLYESDKPARYAFRVEDLKKFTDKKFSGFSVAFDIRPPPPPPVKTAEQEAAVEVEKAKKRAKKEKVEEAPPPEPTVRLILQNDSERNVYTIHSLESTQEQTPLPKVELASSFTVSRSAFAKSLSKIACIAEQVRIEARKGVIYLHGKSDVGEAENSMEEARDVVGDGRAAYTIEYLQKFLKTLREAHRDVVFRYATKLPCRIESTLLQNVVANLWLAPRISDDALPQQPVTQQPTAAAQTEEKKPA